MRRNFRTTCRGRRGFTLVELLVVIAIIAVLMALILPAVQQVRVAAMRTDAQNKLHQIAIACHSYQDSCGYLPDAYGYTSNYYYYGRGGSGGSNQAGAWSFQILPFIEQVGLYEQSAGPVSNNYNYSYTGTYQYTYSDPNQSYTSTSSSVSTSNGGSSSYSNTYPNNPSNNYAYSSSYSYDYTTNPPTYNYSYSYTYGTTTYGPYTYSYPEYWLSQSNSKKGWQASRISGVLELYVNLLDPSVDPTNKAPISFMANPSVLSQSMRLEKITDGTSNTLMLAEGYTKCSGVTTTTYDYLTLYGYPYYYSYTDTYSYVRPWNYDPLSYTSSSDSSGTGDYTNPTYSWGKFVYNYTSTGTDAPTYSTYGIYDPTTYTYKPFQVTPKVSDCQYYAAQSTSRGGLLVAAADASVHNVGNNVSQTTWAALNSPNSRDKIGNDWNP